MRLANMLHFKILKVIASILYFFLHLRYNLSPVRGWGLKALLRYVIFWGKLLVKNLRVPLKIYPRINKSKYCLGVTRGRRIMDLYYIRLKKMKISEINKTCSREGVADF